MKKTLMERFMDKVSPEPNTGCWLWKGYIGGDGYGHYSIPGRKRRGAHRMSWILHKGEIPAGLLVCHKCDVRNCVNPDHLFLGTPAENQADMKRKGRSGAGEKNPRAKLKFWQVQQIKSLLRAGRSPAELAEDFAVSKKAIDEIKCGRRWNHVQPATAISFKGHPMSTFAPAFDFVMSHEDPHRAGKVTEDAGGRTRFGIAQKFHPELPDEFFTGSAEDALKQAEEIMRRDYWQPMRLDEIKSQNVANKLFDMAVNMGVHQAGVYAQRAANGMITAQIALPAPVGSAAVASKTDRGPTSDTRIADAASGKPRAPFEADAAYSELKPLVPMFRLEEDGVLGEKSLATINALEPIAYHQLLCDWSRQHYVHVASINPAQATNLQGWLKRAAA